MIMRETLTQIITSMMILKLLENISLIVNLKHYVKKTLDFQLYILIVEA